MSSRRSRYSSPSPSPYYHSGKYARSLSRTVPSRSGSRSRSRDFSDIANPGNTLYVTGLSSRISKADLKEHFASEGKVVNVHLVVDPYTRESRGFGFVTMAGIEEAEKCIKYLDGSLLEARAMKVEKARRRRGRTPTPGRYLGPTAAHGRSRRSSSSSERERFDSPYYYRRSRSPCSRRRYHCSLDYSRSPSRSVSPRASRRRRSRSRSISPASMRRMRRRNYSRSFSSREARRLRSFSRNTSPADASRRRIRRSYSRSISPRRSSRRSSYRRISNSPAARRRRYRSYSGSISPRSVSHGRRSPSPSRAAAPNLKRGYSCESYSHSRSPSCYSKRSYSRSISPMRNRRRMGASRSRSISPRSTGSRRSPSAKRASCKATKRGYSCESYSHSRSPSS